MADSFLIALVLSPFLIYVAVLQEQAARDSMPWSPAYVLARLSQLVVVAILILTTVIV